MSVKAASERRNADRRLGNRLVMRCSDIVPITPHRRIRYEVRCKKGLVGRIVCIDQQNIPTSSSALPLLEPSTKAPVQAISYALVLLKMDTRVMMRVVAIYEPGWIRGCRARDPPCAQALGQ